MRDVVERFHSTHSIMVSDSDSAAHIDMRTYSNTHTRQEMLHLIKKKFSGVTVKYILLF